MSRKLFVGNLSFQLNDLELEDMFNQYGEVTSAKVITDRRSGRSRGFGFVEMASEDSAKSAIEALDGTEVKGRTIRVSFAKERSDNEYSSRKPRNFNKRFEE